jgi:hypothetical protein
LHPPQQSNLSESIARTKLGDEPTVSDQLRCARFDDIETVSRITLAKYRLAGAHTDGLRTARQLFDSRRPAAGTINALFRIDGLLTR